MLWLVVLKLILVHGAGGEDISVNIAEISSIRQTVSTDFHDNVNCVIVMTNGKFIGTTEKCIDVVHKISEADK